MAWQPDDPSEVSLSPESIEMLARRLSELLQPAEPEGSSRLVSAKVIAERWGVDRRWVYEHADHLGARRLGSGPRPRLRFDPIEVGERLGPGRRRDGCDGRR
ncbi:MAG: hypothetical protein J0H66_12910 [Solirubrobacterales bacterium]|nr:hypothetical protein [Solirubrobacterales bacterium]OJU93389.1 MAG: hypothetical protein BGO23_12020 [Solirubrobacterales bacterium 67-14]